MLYIPYVSVTRNDDIYELAPDIARLPYGKLICYMRENSRLTYPGLKSFSRDEGRTWDGVYETPMAGCVQYHKVYRVDFRLRR